MSRFPKIVGIVPQEANFPQYSPGYAKRGPRGAPFRSLDGKFPPYFTGSISPTRQVFSKNDGSGL